jgi:hypothetical protein
LTRGLRCRETGLCALRPQSAGKLCRLLGPRLLRLKCLLRLRGRLLVTRRPHLSCRAALLFQDVAGQFLLRNGLSGAAKCALPNGLSAKLLALDLAPPSDVLNSLLDCRRFIRAHESFRRGRLVCTRRPGKTSDPLLCRLRPQGPSLLESARRLPRNAASALNSLLATRQSLFICPNPASGRLLSCLLRRGRGLGKTSTGLRSTKASA